MPRSRYRRHRRLEWTNSMQSSVTLVAVEELVTTAQQQRQQAERTYLENSPTSATAPEPRPHRIPQAPSSLSRTTEQPARARRRSAPGVVAHTARVVRSDSEQTASSGDAQDRSAKDPHGFASRLKRKLKIPFAYLHESILGPQARGLHPGVNSYYSVSTH
ncbi:hypothetical protein FBU59_003296 [Linderina macrospora]|uniref:Uncharacterized protein n=1 Tax=Linderina macrospora TaxID=4868 RepID=A0ACC1J8V9_9FUNG|nr:hypothetical protein FBU59_003296 [Linderina macrospora]